MFPEMFVVEIVHHGSLSGPSRAAKKDGEAKGSVGDFELINIDKWDIGIIIFHSDSGRFRHFFDFLFLFLLLHSSIIQKILFIGSMSAVNGFLFDFIKLRKEMTSNPAAGVRQKASSNTRVKYQQDATDNSLNNTLSRIIEKKPHKREVIEYLQERANEHTARKMA